MTERYDGMGELHHCLDPYCELADDGREAIAPGDYRYFETPRTLTAMPYRQDPPPHPDPEPYPMPDPQPEPEPQPTV